MPEDMAFISSKSGVDTSRDGKVMSVAKKSADRQTDGFSSLYSREEEEEEEKEKISMVSTALLEYI